MCGGSKDSEEEEEEEFDFDCERWEEIQRCDGNDSCLQYQELTEEPEECPECCTEGMRQNDSCELECNHQSCNYGNYYRCFPYTDMTDCVNLYQLSLFLIGDNADIDPATENAAINLSYLSLDGRYQAH